MRVTDLCTLEPRDGDEESGVTGYAVDPDVMYPAMVDYCRKLADGTVDPPSYVAMYRADIRKLPAGVWDDALVDTNAHVSNDGRPGIPAERAREYNQAVELCRLVFTALLREQAGGPIRIHITRPTDAARKGAWRAYPVQTPLPNSTALGQGVLTFAPTEG